MKREKYAKRCVVSVYAQEKKIERRIEIDLSEKYF
jgi:hypothetical protein